MSSIHKLSIDRLLKFKRDIDSIECDGQTVGTEEPNVPFRFNHAHLYWFAQSDSSSCSAGETEPMLESLKRKDKTSSVAIELKAAMSGVFI